MKKKALSLTLALAVTAGLLAGCSSSGTAEETTTAAAAETTAAETTAAAAEETTAAEASGEKPFAGQTLTVSTFSFNAELLQKNIYDPFMEQTGCELIVEGGKTQNVSQRSKKIPLPMT